MPQSAVMVCNTHTLQLGHKDISSSEGNAETSLCPTGQKNVWEVLRGHDINHGRTYVFQNPCQLLI